MPEFMRFISLILFESLLVFLLVLSRLTVLQLANPLNSLCLVERLICYILRVLDNLYALTSHLIVKSSIVFILPSEVNISRQHATHSALPTGMRHRSIHTLHAMSLRRLKAKLHGRLCHRNRKLPFCAQYNTHLFS